MKGYFWANLNGTIVNWQVNRFRLYRGARPMDLLWELALERGAVDEIMLSVPRTSAHTSEVVREAGNNGFGDPLKDHPKHPEAFLTVTDGRQAKGAKYRLKGFSFLRCENTPEGNGAPSEDFQILLDLDKVERARVGAAGRERLAGEGCMVRPVLSKTTRDLKSLNNATCIQDYDIVVGSSSTPWWSTSSGHAPC